MISTLVPSKLQTKSWRKNQEWYDTGKRNECEIFQKQQLKNLFGIFSKSTNIRINSVNGEMIKISNHCLNKLENCYDYTEDFDVISEKYKLFINLKFVCDKGGAQTRTLKEVRHFIQSQEKAVLDTDYYFINILDGDGSYNCIHKIKSGIQSNPRVFIGDMKEFGLWFNKHFIQLLLNNSVGKVK